MKKFKLVSAFKPTGDQPQAIEKLVKGVNNGLKQQVLLGVTGSGKTFTMANVIEKLQVPTLVISHNKTLAAQLFQEFREFFPQNAVEYFVSYYDYYQPEAYVPQRDQYIAKEADINDLIDKLRLSTTSSLLSRRDVIVVASVSCIYNIGSPAEYGKAVIKLKAQKSNLDLNDLVLKLIDLHYERNDYDFKRSTFRVRGNVVDIWPSYKDDAVRVNFGFDGVESLASLDPLTGDEMANLDSIVIYPAKHFMTSKEVYQKAFAEIRSDLQKRLTELKKAGKNLEAQRLKQRTEYDLELIKEIGYCPGIENYSRYFDGRKPGDPPFTLLDYFTPTESFLTIIDESHITIPQVRGMYEGDRARKQTLVDYGFRLPSALDNRPLKFSEFQQRLDSVIYTSATPSDWEINASQGVVVEQLIRPTGLLDPEVEIRGTKGQVADLITEIETREKRGERVLVTTLTKRMAEELATFLEDRGIKVHYLHADVDTLERTAILADFRRGTYDVVVGINLLREGLDLPEVSLVAILDADKEGFLRSETSLIQTMGRAARHLHGKVIMYADKVTASMQRAIAEVNRRRQIQLDYNKKHGIIPQSIVKPIRERVIEEKEAKKGKILTAGLLKKAKEMPPGERQKLVDDLNRRMRRAADDLDFETAADLRDAVIAIKKSLRNDHA
jgi:excinuclease ABC subunit B